MILERPVGVIKGTTREFLGASTDVNYSYYLPVGLLYKQTFGWSGEDVVKHLEKRYQMKFQIDSVSDKLNTKIEKTYFLHLVDRPEISFKALNSYLIPTDYERQLTNWYIKNYLENYCNDRKIVTETDYTKDDVSTDRLTISCKGKDDAERFSADVAGMVSAILNNPLLKIDNHTYVLGMRFITSEGRSLGGTYITFGGKSGTGTNTVVDYSNPANILQIVMSVYDKVK